MRKYSWVLAVALVWACGNPTPGNPRPGASSQAASAQKDQLARGEVVKPPFAVRDDAEGLLLVWYDAEGQPHTAQKRSDVPEDRREHVRVDSLELAPEARLDPAFVYVADLREPGTDRSYVVRKLPRDAFEAAMVPAAKSDEALAKAGDDVIIYGASWCGACKAAARYLTQKHVPFVEKDIEREPAARSEMLAKAQAQGVNTSGIPVIDVYGTLMGGFDPSRMEQLLARK